MKTIKQFSFVLTAVFFVFASCQRDAHRDITSATNEPVAAPVAEAGTTEMLYGKPKSPNESCNPDAYTVTLESKTAIEGGWEWVWSVQNPNPGNGNNGTAQDLSHWGMHFGACFTTSSMVSAGYSGDGTNWTTFTPSYQPDPSQGCMSDPVLKFDFGTQGSLKSYYKLVVNADYPIGSTSAYYKSGGNTGCCTFSFAGISCDDNTNPR